MPATTTELLQRRLDKALDRHVTGATVAVHHHGGHLSWSGGAGDLQPDAPFFIASVTKLMTTALILQLIHRGELDFEDRLVDILDLDLTGLHTFKGVDYTGEITVARLLSQTSGLADYFLGKASGGGLTLERQVRQGQDQRWDLAQVLQWAREQGGRFAPGTPGKALYSDTNFQLLGAIIEQRTGQTYAEVLNAQIIEPLSLKQTWLYTDPEDDRPAPLRDGPAALVIPKAMVSFGPDGGIVSTSQELVVMVRAFFEGELFPAEMLVPLQIYRRVMFPLEYGTGFMRFQLPRWMTAFQASPELLGHAGLSGAFAFCDPKYGLYFAGTVNQIARPQRAFKLLLRIHNTVMGHLAPRR
ncbi:MAG: serine hydrolase domain-containing protein [Bradymonadia bacterium]